MGVSRLISFVFSVRLNDSESHYETQPQPFCCNGLLQSFVNNTTEPSTCVSKLSILTGVLLAVCLAGIPVILLVLVLNGVI